MSGNNRKNGDSCEKRVAGLFGYPIFFTALVTFANCDDDDYLYG